jgi:DNA-binding GntR family transcriptional regulator
MDEEILEAVSKSTNRNLVTSSLSLEARSTPRRRRPDVNFASAINLPVHTPLWETVALSLRQSIILGDLLPGLHLEEPALAERFQVSRSSAREALSQLAHEGFVQIEPRRGAFVVGLTEAAIRDIYELRFLLETHAGRRAVERADAEVVANLYAIVDQISHALDRSRPDLLAFADLGLHRQIIVLGGNDRIRTAWEPNAGVIRSMMSVAATADFTRRVVVDRHREIVRALELRDAQAYEDRLKTMMEDSQKLMIDILHSVQARAAKGAD